MPSSKITPTAECRKFRDFYVLSRTLGDGNFSLVRKCRHKFSRGMYAAKIVKLPTTPTAEKENHGAIVARDNDDYDSENGDKDNTSGHDTYEDILDMVRNEVSIVRKLKHENIVQFVDVFYSTADVIIVTELTEHGDLQAYILKETIFEDTARLFCLQIASAINYMHSYKIVHRDIKPENILMFKSKTDTAYTLKLCDFGLAEEITMCGLQRVCGSPSFIAPEILEFKSYGLAIDVWSMGILFYLILSSYVPFDDDDLSEKFDLIMHTDVEFPPPEWEAISTDAKGLIRRMLQKNPKKRLKASQVMYHRWFRKSDVGNWRSSITRRLSEVSHKTFKGAVGAVNTMKMFAANRKMSRDDAIISRKLVENTFLLSKSARLKGILVPAAEPARQTENCNTSSHNSGVESGSGLSPATVQTKKTNNNCNNAPQSKSMLHSATQTENHNNSPHSGSRLTPTVKPEKSNNQSGRRLASAAQTEKTQNNFPKSGSRLSASSSTRTSKPSTAQTTNKFPPINTSNSVLRATSDESITNGKCRTLTAKS